MVKSAIISKDQVYRYELSRIWDTTKKIIMWQMLNPSKADAEEDDNTVSRLISFTKAWGFGGFLVGNFYAFRCTDSAELFKNPEVDYVGPDNPEHLIKMAKRVDRIIVAPGNLVVKEHYDSVLQVLAYTVPGVKFYYLKMTKKGFPSHPLYLKSGLSPKRLEIPEGEPDLIIAPSTGGIITGEVERQELQIITTKDQIEEIRKILKEQQEIINGLKGTVTALQEQVKELKDVIDAERLGRPAL